MTVLCGENFPAAFYDRTVHPAHPDDTTSGPPLPVDAAFAARVLCQAFDRIDEPTDADLERWQARIRGWAARRRIRRYGTARHRTYLLPELYPVATRCHTDPRTAA